MELKEFVKRTLAEIAEGVSEGAKAAEAFGAIVNPRGFMMGIESDEGENVSIEFTVGLSISDATQTKGGIGVVAGIFAIGSQGQSNDATLSTTHIKFNVPMVLPSPIKRKVAT